MEETLQSVSSIEWGPVLAILGAFLAVFLGGLGSSLAIGQAGQKAAGVMAEKPNLFGSLLVLTALPGSQGIYGLLIAIFILSGAGMLGGGDAAVSMNAGMMYLVSGLVIGFAALSSAVLQGRVVTASVGALAREESVAGKAVTMSVIIEAYAIFGLLVAIFIALAANGA